MEMPVVSMERTVEICKYFKQLNSDYGIDKIILSGSCEMADRTIERYLSVTGPSTRFTRNVLNDFINAYKAILATKKPIVPNPVTKDYLDFKILISDDALVPDDTLVLEQLPSDDSREQLRVVCDPTKNRRLYRRSIWAGIFLVGCALVLYIFFFLTRNVRVAVWVLRFSFLGQCFLLLGIHDLYMPISKDDWYAPLYFEKHPYQKATLNTLFYLWSRSLFLIKICISIITVLFFATFILF